MPQRLWFEAPPWCACATEAVMTWCFPDRRWGWTEPILMGWVINDGQQWWIMIDRESICNMVHGSPLWLGRKWCDLLARQSASYANIIRMETCLELRELYQSSEAHSVATNLWPTTNQPFIFPTQAPDHDSVTSHAPALSWSTVNQQLTMYQRHCSPA